MSNIDCGVSETKLIVQIKCVCILELLVRRDLPVPGFFFYSTKYLMKYNFNITCGFSLLPFPKLNV